MNAENDVNNPADFLVRRTNNMLFMRDSLDRSERTRYWSDGMIGLTGLKKKKSKLLNWVKQKH